MQLISGWLWFDDNKKTTPADKLLGALVAYKARHGREPVNCYVASDTYTLMGGNLFVTLRPHDYVRENYFLLNEEMNETNL